MLTAPNRKNTHRSGVRPREKIYKNMMENQVMTEEMGMEQFLSQSIDTKPGVMVEGTIVSVASDFILVDIGAKSEASLSAKEFSGHPPKPGEKIQVLVLKLNGPEGRPLVSHRQAKERKYWDSIFEAFQNKKPIKGKILQRVKGGVRVDIGMEAFMPSSQIDLRPEYHPEKWIGKEVEVRVLEMNKAKGSVLVSRRQILEEKKEVLKGQTLETLQEGQVFKGCVTGMTNFGAFIDIGGVEGLLHVSDMAWARIDNPQDLFKVGDEVEVKVIKYDAAKKKISLGRKHLLPHPLDGIEAKYKIGDMMKGKVTSIATFGAFVEIEPGVEGLIHLSEFSWTDKIKSPKDVVKVGQEIETRFIGFDREKEKISLSIKRIGESPWVQASKLYPKGTAIDAEVTQVVPFGVFVKIPLGIEALIKTQDLSWTQTNNSAQKKFKPGDKIKAVVLSIDVKEEKMALGIRQLNADPIKELHIGQTVEAKVQKITDFGIFVTMDSGLDALIRKNELTASKRSRDDAPEMAAPEFKVGENIQASVLKINKKDRKVELSVRRFERTQEKELLRKYSGQQGRMTLGQATGWTDEK